MSKLRPLAVLVIAFLFGISGAVGLGLLARSSEPPATVQRPSVALRGLSDGLYVASQIMPADVDAVVMRGIKTVIDMRPDGEAEDQPKSDLIRQLAKNRGMSFAYVPVPQGEEPDALVDTLAQTLARSPGPVLLYSRSGRSAARTWALAEASRNDGLSIDRIEAQVVAVGQPIDDLTERLRLRLARRNASP